MTDDDLAIIRSWCGSTVGSIDHPLHPWNDVEDRLARLHTPEAVALEILRQRRADFTADPASYGIEGDATVNTAENLRQLDRQISRLEQHLATGGDGTLTSGRLTRPDRAR